MAGAVLWDGHAWGAWLGLGIVSVAAVGLAFWQWRRRGSWTKAPPKEPLPGEGRHRQLFDSTPVQILEEDFTAIMDSLSRLRAEGVTDFITHLTAHPGLSREWLERVRLVDANRPAVVAAGFADRQAMIADFPRHAPAPHLEVFNHQLSALWSDRRLFEDEIRYLDSGGNERACLMKCQVDVSSGRADFSRVVLALSDITTAKRTASAQVENQELLRKILSRADILLWWGQVRREDGHLRWKINVPSQSFDSPLFQLATARDKGGLWDAEHVPEHRQIDERASQAIYSGKAGYQHEFRVIASTGETHWLSEDVGIFRLGADEWSLLGVVMDVTARRTAEEARQASEAQLREILKRADCMLWRANIVREGDSLSWRDFEMPGSVLHQRLFGAEHPVSGTGLWLAADAPELPEMNRRSTEAIVSGSPGYEHEFRVIRPEGNLWLHEQVSITPAGRERWSLVGVITDVTAQHEAEEARRASEERLGQLLKRADCMLWQAQVIENAAGGMDWVLYIPRSILYQELFGKDPSENPNLMWSELNVPELAEMNARSTDAVRSGMEGYEQEFAALRDGRTYRLHEQVSITRVASGRWNLVGVITDVTTARQAEEAQRKSQTQLQQILMRTDCMLWHARVTESDGRHKWEFDIPVSGLQKRIFGCESGVVHEGITGIKARSLYGDFTVADQAAMDAVALGAMRSGAPGYEQAYSLNKADQTFWLQEWVSITPVGPGQWDLVGITIDVTPQHKALAAIQASEGRYRAIFENIPVAVIELDLRGLGRALQRWNAGGVRDVKAYLAAHPEELAGLPDSVAVAAINETALRLYKAESKDDFHREGHRPSAIQVLGALQEWIEAVRQGRNDGEAEVEIRDFAGGRHRTFMRWWMPSQTEWFQLEHAVVALVDLTELKRTEAALAAEKERLAVTLRAMAEGVVTTDTRGIVQFMNRAGAELTEFDADKAVGRPLAEICVLRGQRSGEEFRLPLSRVIEERMLVELPPQTRLVGRGGGSCMVEGCCAPVHDAESKIIGTVLVIRDVTVRQRFEEELERASRLESIGILAGGIAHDFNNILTAILGNITLAMPDAGQLVAVEGNLREAERAALRARDLTQQLLTFAKGGDPVRAAVLLPEIIRDVSEFTLHGSRVKCEFDLPAGLWLADADKSQFGQVVQNLVINAIQAMPEGGTIRIGAANEVVPPETRRPLVPGNYVHISVADTGTGIKPEHLARIFDPYFTTKQQGSGLGLTTVYSIIRKHQGHIEAESELGRGSTFHFWLPALRERQTEIVESRADAGAPMKGRVLFMDDEKSILSMAGLLLRRLGFEVELACDGAETVQKYSAAHSAGRPFDLVVMDLTVPGGMGGREAIEQLRKIDPGVRAIVSSGYSNDPVLANHRAYGFCGMVAKPYKVDDFARVLRAVLRESRPPMAQVSHPAKPGLAQPDLPPGGG
jgi:PAS domain S-box-containing protein